MKNSAGHQRNKWVLGSRSLLRWTYYAILGRHADGHTWTLLSPLGGRLPLHCWIQAFVSEHSLLDSENGFLKGWGF